MYRLPGRLSLSSEVDSYKSLPGLEPIVFQAGNHAG
jgi:hypothetical protein